eukprot:s2881_g2.t1
MGTEEKSDSLVEWKQRDANECGGPHLRELREQTGFQCVSLLQQFETLSAERDFLTSDLEAGFRPRRHPEHELFLRREIRCLRELQHRNIVNLIAAFWEAGSCFIVLDLAREGDLSERIDSCTGVGRDPANSDCAARYVMQQLLAAIGYMHQRRVIHRDLKLENVLISSSVPAPEPLECLLYDVKVTDFGLSTWLDIDNESLTPVGTPHYFAPEVLQNDYDTRIDFFSLGVILYVMLCGNFPFDPNSSDPDALVDSYSWECVSPEGKDMSRRLLEKDPNKRLNHAQCLQHAWLQSQNQPVPDISLVLEEDHRGPTRTRPMPRARSLEEPGRCLAQVLCSASVLGQAGRWTTYAFIGVGERQLLEIRGVGASEDRYQYLGNSLVFLTSECNVLAFQGDDAMTRSRFIAPSDSQTPGPGLGIVGLQFQGSDLIGVHLQANAEDGAGAVAEIGGRDGSAVDQVFLTLRRGAVRRYGRRGGQQASVLFSDRGNADVITWLGTQEYWGTEVQVEVEGSYDGSGNLHVDSIKRLNDGSVWQGSGASGLQVLFSDRGNADVITWLGTQEYWGTEVQVECVARKGWCSRNYFHYNPGNNFHQYPGNNFHYHPRNYFHYNPRNYFYKYTGNNLYYNSRHSEFRQLHNRSPGEPLVDIWWWASLAAAVVPVELQWNERIVIVEQARRDAHLGNSISFYLSSGKLYKLSGLESTRSRRFAAPAGHQICGLDFDGGGLLSRVSTCPRTVCCPTSSEMSYHMVKE